ncbi:TIR domain-containing protein [Agromyces sp. NPDC058136]|uniref:TIR domain-containing protein n=1 Tax=Agromyces sp. NPDC058136 TaxID=3346354 RepID=UPI0036DD3577
MPKLSAVHDYFLSHAGPDKDFVKGVGTRMQLAGREVFLDEWSIEYGESIPGAIETALRENEAFVLFWSEKAKESAWTTKEYRSAVSRFIDDDDRTLVLVRLDDTEVPELIRDMKWIDGRGGDPDAVADALMGMRGNDRLIAMQNTLSELGIRMEYFHGYGVLLACPKCGATVDKLAGWSETDDERDDTYAGARCTVCGWHDGGEI